MGYSHSKPRPLGSAPTLRVGPRGPLSLITNPPPECSAPGCVRAATKRSPDFDLIWCDDCAGPKDLPLETPKRNGGFVLGPPGGWTEANSTHEGGQSSSALHALTHAAEDRLYFVVADWGYTGIER